MGGAREVIDGWVCLMYHDVLPQRSAVSGGPEHFAVSQAGFARQLELIAEQGYSGCSLVEALRRRGERRVAISFDDGNSGQFARAFPALAARGMTATFFVTTSWVGRTGFVSWNQLREMKAAGMSVQSHTHTHPFLSELAAPALGGELRASKATLDQELGQDTDALALPGGDQPAPGLRHLVAEAGYRVVATSRWGVNRSLAGPGALPYHVRRCTVRGEPDLERFARVVAGDPWVGLARRARDAALGALRSGVGPSRYSRWRRQFLDRYRSADDAAGGASR